MDYALNKLKPNDPLRPLEVPSYGAKQEEMNSMPNHHLHLETSDVSAVSSLMYAMSDLVGDLRMDVNPERINISEQIANNNILVTLCMNKSVFDKYECTGNMVFCFQPKLMYKYISRHQTNSIMSWDLKAKKSLTRQQRAAAAKSGDEENNTNEQYFVKQAKTSYFLLVTIRSTTDMGAQYHYEYYVPLLRSFKQTYKSHDMKMDYLLALDSNLLTNDILSMFNLLQREIMTRYVKISCTPQKITFEMVGDSSSTINHAKFTSIIAKSDGLQPPAKRARRKKKQNSADEEVDIDIEREEVQCPCVVAHYNLIYLTRLQKCFSTHSGVVYLYIKQNYPLIFDTRIGTLGNLRAVLMFRTEMEE